MGLSFFPTQSARGRAHQKLAAGDTEPTAAVIHLAASRISLELGTCGRGEAANPLKKYKCASSLPLRLYTRYKGLWSPRYSRDAAQFLLSKWYRLYAKVNPSPPRVADDGTAFSRAAPPARPEETPSRMSPLPGRGLRLGFVGLALQSASAHTAAARFLPALPS